MATTLCEKCFPDWGHHEVQSKAIFAICEECQKTETQDDVKLHTFRGDPRHPTSPKEFVDSYTEFIRSGFYKAMQKQLSAVTRERDEARSTMNLHIDHLWGVIHKKELERELERDALRAEVERLTVCLNRANFQARDDALEEAAQVCYCDSCADNIRARIAGRKA